MVGAGNVLLGFSGRAFNYGRPGTFEEGKRAANLYWRRSRRTLSRPHKIPIEPRLVMRKSTLVDVPISKPAWSVRERKNRASGRREKTQVRQINFTSETKESDPCPHEHWFGRCRGASITPALPAAQDPSNGLASTPPMGWNSWNKFGCNVNEDMIRQMADAMVSSGMKDAGYQYVVIDDCWQVERDASGNIVADAKHFPSGIKALADYVHSRGLKFGIYSDAGA